MTNLKRLFDSLDNVEAPDVWSDVQAKEILGEDRFLAKRSFRSRTWKVASAAVALVVIATLVVTFSDRETSTAYAAFTAASDAMSEPGIRFRFEGVQRSDEQVLSVTGTAVGRDKTHYTETTEYQGVLRPSRVWLIVGSRAYLKQGDSWSRWPHNWPDTKPRGTTEGVCLSVRNEVDFVFEISDWLRKCHRGWKLEGTDEIDGMRADRYEFNVSEFVKSKVWIGADDRHVLRFESKSEKTKSFPSQEVIWRFFDYGGSFDVVEPMDFTGPGTRGQDFRTGEKIVIAKGELPSGSDWQVLAWTQEPLEGLCVGLSFGGRSSGSACGAKPGEIVQGKSIGDIGMVTTGDDHKIALLSEKVVKVRLEYRDGREDGLADVIRNPAFDVNFFVIVHERGEGSPTIVALDREGKELGRA